MSENEIRALLDLCQWHGPRADAALWDSPEALESQMSLGAARTAMRAAWEPVYGSVTR